MFKLFTTKTRVLDLGRNFTFQAASPNNVGLSSLKYTDCSLDLHIYASTTVSSSLSSSNHHNMYGACNYFQSIFIFCICILMDTLFFISSVLVDCT